MRDPSPGIDPAAALGDWQQAQSGVGSGEWTHYNCTLATPMYGGGVRPGEVDEAMPIRAAGLRGQLRFWWRLACGPFASSEAMFERESAIWGGIGSSGPAASKVRVRVEAKPATSRLTTLNQIASFPSYVLILDPGANPTLLAKGFSFSLGLRLDQKLAEAQRAEVQTALRWWASFGGVGARTRRGLGAVQAKGLDPVTAEEVGARGGRLLLLGVAKDESQAWKQSVNQLRLFRQGKEIGRNPGQTGSNRPGQSRWPEADTIRRLSGQHASRHAPNPDHPSAFPRAAFGLPIIFQFKDPGEPKDHTLEPEDGDRMASPLVLRPYWDGKGWRPAALLLPAWKTALGVPLKFKAQSYNPAPWPDESADRAALAAQIKPMDGRSDDPLTAFLAYFQEA